MPIAAGATRRQLLGGLAGLALAGRPAAAPLPVEVEVAPDLTLTLADGSRVRLAGVVVPGAFEGGEGSRAAAAFLRETLAGGVRLPPDPMPLDRWGRRVGVVTAADGQDVQGGLLEAGLALVDPSTPMPGAAMTASWLAQERRARRNGRGLWQEPDTVLRPPEEAQDFMGGFGIVRGTPLRTNARRTFTYVDFARRWRDGFSLRAEARTAKRLKERGLDLLALEGVVVEVRGWVFRAGGPMIEVTAREQVEVVA